MSKAAVFNREDALRMFVDNAEHTHLDEDVVKLLHLGTTTLPVEDKALLIRAHMVVSGCAVCVAMEDAHHSRRSEIAPA